MRSSLCLFSGGLFVSCTDAVRSVEPEPALIAVLLLFLAKASLEAVALLLFPGGLILRLAELIDDVLRCEGWDRIGGTVPVESI